VSDSLPAAIEAQEWRPTLPAVGEVFCYRDDSGTGRPVLLLHSVNAAPSAMEVRPLFEYLRGSRPVLAPDLPGFGRSPREDRIYTPEFYSAMIRELLAAYGDSCHVVALSTAAEFAARAAVEDATYIASLTVVSPTGLSGRSPPTGATSERIYGFLRTPLLGSALFRLLRSGPSIRYFLGLAFEDAPPAELVRYARLTAAQPGARFVPFHFLSGKLFTATALADLYRPQPVPGLVLYDRDPNISFERLDELLDSAPQWRAERIPGTLGLPHYDQPDVTFPVLERFWREVEDGAPSAS
jgi:pimeloyl-ACP methyl ester carboxylesterase